MRMISSVCFITVIITSQFTEAIDDNARNDEGKEVRPEWLSISDGSSYDASTVEHGSEKPKCGGFSIQANVATYC